MQIAKGAEAVILREGVEVTKERVRKGYRLQALDEKLRKKRTKSEAALLRAARRAGVNVPAVLDESGFSLQLQFIEGKKLRDVLESRSCEELGRQIAEAATRLHSYGIIHGDLTTSNMILHEGRVFLIDFGLGFQSQRIEDKAVDMYVLQECLESTHPSIKERLWSIILENYAEGEDAKKVIKTLHQIEKRGRYRNRVD